MVKTVKTMQGKTLDMEKLQMANELTPAVGNVKVNARGDELGSAGKIVKTREEAMKEFYDKRNKNAVKPDNVMVPDSDGE
jgi:hypothetical protein